MHSMEIQWRDIENMRMFERAARMVGSQFEFANASRRAVNRTGDMARTRVVRALAGQTGLQQKLLRKAVKPTRANYDRIAYVMRAKGGDISLKYFKPRETRKGVSAAPFGKREVFASSFMRGGRFPHRVAVPRFHGHVFERDGRERTPITKLKSGVIIPAEMVQGETAKAFESAVRQILPVRFAHEINRLTGGAFA
ncbi:phage tail protein [Pelagibacterium nitratireducens]|uniref:Phage tail protein n=1 Tax=Pelagibacterium nitratireducens TaxID=1046114 RepID=A0ABZ2I0J0_9HYPH